MTNPMLIEEATGARQRVASGNRSPIAGPSDLFRTRDGWIMVQVIGQSMFERWTRLVERPELLSDERFSNDQARGVNGVFLSRVTAKWAVEKSNSQCLELLRKNRLPASPVLLPSEVLTAPEVALSGLVQSVRQADGSAIPLVVPPIRFGDAPAPLLRPAPSLGQDTLAILREAGFDESRIAELISSETIDRAAKSSTPQALTI